MGRIRLVAQQKGFNAATLRVIDFLGGDRQTGKCLCPCHADGSGPSLSVSSGDKVAVVLHCFGRNDRQHDLDIIAHLRAAGVWPTSDGLVGAQASPAADAARSPDDRRRFALQIWNALCRRNGWEMAQELLPDYMKTRGLNKVPETALLTLPLIPFLHQSELTI